VCDDSQSLSARKRFAPLIERRKRRRDLATFIRQRVAHFERALSHDTSLNKACARQIAKRSGQHLLRDARYLASKFGESGSPFFDRRENDRAPSSSKRRQRNIDAAHVEPVPHALNSSRH
jgi:hypothetical protein